MGHRCLMVAVLALFAWAPPACAAEHILDYDVLIQVQADASLEITENITVRAEGTNIRRGIYRDFPTRYRDQGGNAVVVDLEVLGVERNQQSEPWFTERLSNGVRINTGNDDYLPVPREHRFTLRYRTTRQLGFFAGHDELYFNAIAQDWMFPIQAARVKVHLPSPVPVERMNAEGYTGPHGAKGQDYRVDLPAPGVALWTATRPLSAHEGMTVVLGFPKGLVPEPTRTQRMIWLLKDNRGVLIALTGLLVLLGYCIRCWVRVGRDPARGVVIARYEPPSGFSPAGLRYMVRRSHDPRCFTADVLDLAVKGYLLIDRQKGLFKATWSLQRMPANPGSRKGSLNAIQGALLRALFSAGGPRLLLHSVNAEILQACNYIHSTQLEKVFHPRFFHRNRHTLTVALALVFAFVVAAFVFSGGAGLLSILGVIGLMCFTLIAFSFLVQAPTPEGRRLLDEIEGLRRYLTVADRDELKNLAGPDAPPELDAGRYERLLPYAVALDVEQAWTRKFTQAVGATAAAAIADTGVIDWYRGGGDDSLGGLTRAVSSSLSSAIASSSSPPGSSSGSDGGGSSGGGGGGGGGGGR